MSRSKTSKKKRRKKKTGLFNEVGIRIIKLLYCRVDQKNRRVGDNRPVDDGILFNERTGGIFQNTYYIPQPYGNLYVFRV